MEISSSPTIYTNHCRRINEQLQHRKPIWDGKLFELQNLLKDIASSSPLSMIDTEVKIPLSLSLLIPSIRQPFFNVVQI